MVTQTMPPPQSWRNCPQNQQFCHLPPHEWSAGDTKCPRVAREGPRVTRGVPAKESHDQCGGGGRKHDFFKYFSINGYFKKPILQERGAKTFFYLTSMSKSAFLFSMSCEKQISCLYSVRACIESYITVHAE